MKGMGEFLLINDGFEQEPVNPPMVNLEEATRLGRLAKFFFTRRDHFFSAATEIRNQLIQILAAGTSWGVFYGSAKKYAESKSPEEGVLYVASTTIAATIFTYVVSDEFFTKYQNKVARKLTRLAAEAPPPGESIPELHSDSLTDITDIIRVPTASERRLSTAYITLGACGASWPFTFVGLQYSPIKMLWFLALYGVVLQIDNTVLHFLAIYLAFNHKGYGFLRTAWNRLSRWVRLSVIKDARQLTLRLIEEQRMADCAELMDILGEKLTQSRQHLIEQCLTDLEQNGQIRIELFDFDQSLGSGLKNLLSLIEMNPNHALVPSSSHNYANKVVHVIGAVETNLSYLGYIVGLFNSVADMSAKWGKWLQGLFVFAAGVVPNYFFATLMAYVGGGAAERFLDYVVDCFKHKKISLAPEIRFNLRAFYLYALLAVPITWYSPGSAPQVNEDNIPGPYAHFLAVNSQYGVRFLLAIIFVDFFIVVARKKMIYGKVSEARDFFRFLQCYDDAIDNLKLFEPTALEEDMKMLAPQEKRVLFGLEESVLDEKLNHRVNLLSRLKRESESSYLPASLYATLFGYQVRAKNRLEGDNLEFSRTSESSFQVALLSYAQYH